MSSTISCVIGENTVCGFPKKIGGVTVNNPVWLAPMAGITYYSLRKFYKELGAGLLHTEMISALGLCYKGQKTKELLYGGDEEQPLVLQLFGSNAEDIKKGAEIALEIRNFKAIEINMACPMPKVTKKGSGSALMKAPDEALKIVASLTDLGLPVWSKIRRFNDNKETAIFCERLLNAGASQIFIHGRTQSQRYEGITDRTVVAEAARNFPSMISASGDCYTIEDFREYLDMGCPSVLAARGILRDICLIPKTLAMLGAKVDINYTEPTVKTQLELMVKLCDEIYFREGDSRAQVMAHRMIAGIFKGIRGSGELRRATAFLKSWQEMRKLLTDNSCCFSTNR